MKPPKYIAAQRIEEPNTIHPIGWTIWTKPSLGEPKGELWFRRS